MLRSICVDFDRVIHQYTSPWTNATTIADPPVEGAFEWLAEMVDHFRVHIFSSRSHVEGGIDAMVGWFEKHGMRRSVLCNLIFPQHKPAAVLYIDDRAFHFQGRFPTKEEITEFKPWHPNDANEECEARVDRLAKELVRTLADLASYAGSVTLPDGREYRLSVERIEK